MAAAWVDAVRLLASPRSRDRRRSPSAAARGDSSSRAPVPRRENVQHGAQLFSERCSGCHTLDVVGAAGLAPRNVRDARAHRRPELQRAQRDARQRPLRDPQRRLLRRDHARRTSWSGKDADEVAAFLAKYAGRAQASPQHGGDRLPAPRRRRLRVLDLRLIRRDPDAVRAALARRGDGWPSGSTRLLELDARRRDAAARSSRRCAPSRTRPSEAIAARQAGGRGRERGDRARCRTSPAQVKALERGAARRSRSELDAGARRRCPTCPTRPPRRRGRRSLREVGEAGRATGRDHLELAGERDRHGARRAPVGLALRLPARRPRAARARARALGAGEARAATASSRSSRRCSCARRRCTAPASCPTPSSRSTACPTTTCTSSAPARWRWPRCTPARSSTARRCRCATPASRPASGARRAPPARTRAASSACTSSTRSRCSRSSSPSDVARRARAAAGDRGGDPAGARDPLPRGQHRASTTSAPRAAKKYDCEAWLPGQERYRELTSTLEHDRLPGAPPGHPLPARERRRPRARAHAQRHRGRRRPHDHRAARERPARGRQRRAARGRCVPYGAPAG